MDDLKDQIKRLDKKYKRKGVTKKTAKESKDTRLFGAHKDPARQR